ncbi:glycosyltransferase family 4 protein [Rhodoferax sp. AJA081-3]|uniref:glycosyltransferase family 4 protein n=1 Tax=Rhodoferax sp. AJA081-3 TaxID=2752316 RepID=UPI001AE012FA|nr:glycosyltransferase family 4 protein [Rhodoferax sp. AJA081-3]QTN26861.1 glycosyltransferase family 4 protein [Rhodoferax sp. AJA081-3]
MKSKKILIISDVSSYMKGGVPSETRHLILGLHKRGFAVALAANAILCQPDLAEFLQLKFPLDQKKMSDLEKFCAIFNPDLIHVIAMSSSGIFKLEPFLKKYNWVLTIHSVPPHERILRYFHATDEIHYAARYLRFIFNTIAWRLMFLRIWDVKVIVHSQYVAEAALNTGANKNNIHIVPLPFVPSQYALDASPRLKVNADLRIVSIGGLAHTKGQHDLVKAIAVIKKTLGKVNCKFIGEVRDKSYYKYLQKLVIDLDLIEDVEIHTELNDAERDVLLSNCDVYVQPSHEEGFCIAYLEAAAIVPRLVGTSTGAIVLVSEGDLGARVVPISSYELLAGAVLDVARAVLSDNHMLMRRERLNSIFGLERYLDTTQVIYFDESADKNKLATYS